MNQDWLSQLAPEHAPTPPGWWPPAPGWWTLALLCVVLIAILVWRTRGQRRVPKRAALRQLQVIRASDADGPAVARATVNLMRRYALAMFGPDRVARLTGEAWLSFVIDAGGEALAGAPGRSLLAAAFGNHPHDDREHWIAGAESFIRRARVPPTRYAPFPWLRRAGERSAREPPAGTTGRLQTVLPGSKEKLLRAPGGTE